MNDRKRGYSKIVLASFATGFITASVLFCGAIKDYIDYRTIQAENQELRKEISKKRDENLILSGIIIGQTLSSQVQEDFFTPREKNRYQNVSFIYDQANQTNENRNMNNSHLENNLSFY